MVLFRKVSAERDRSAPEGCEDSDSLDPGPTRGLDPIVGSDERDSTPEAISHDQILPESVDPVGDSVLGAVAALTAKVDQLLDRDDREHRLYEDLSKLRQEDDVVRSLPLFRSVIQVIDRVDELQHGDHDLVAALPQIGEELVELLERYGIEQIERAEDDGFDASLQKAIGQLDSESTSELQIVGAGYSYGARIIRHQHVLVKPADRPVAAPVVDQLAQVEP